MASQSPRDRAFFVSRSDAFRPSSRCSFPPQSQPLLCDIQGNSGECVRPSPFTDPHDLASFSSRAARDKSSSGQALDTSACLMGVISGGVVRVRRGGGSDASGASASLFGGRRGSSSTSASAALGILSTPVAMSFPMLHGSSIAGVHDSAFDLSSGTPLYQMLCGNPVTGGMMGSNSQATVRSPRLAGVPRFVPGGFGPNVFEIKGVSTGGRSAVDSPATLSMALPFDRAGRDTTVSAFLQSCCALDQSTESYSWGAGARTTPRRVSQVEEGLGLMPPKSTSSSQSNHVAINGVQPGESMELPNFARPLAPIASRDVLKETVVYPISEMTAVDDDYYDDSESDLCIPSLARRTTMVPKRPATDLRPLTDTVLEGSRANACSPLHQKNHQNTTCEGFESSSPTQIITITCNALQAPDNTLRDHECAPLDMQRTLEGFNKNSTTVARRSDIDIDGSVPNRWSSAADSELSADNCLSPLSRGGRGLNNHTLHPNGFGGVAALHPFSMLMGGSSAVAIVPIAGQHEFDIDASSSMGDPLGNEVRSAEAAGDSGSFSCGRRTHTRENSSAQHSQGTCAYGEHEDRGDSEETGEAVSGGGIDSGSPFGCPSIMAAADFLQQHEPNSAPTSRRTSLSHNSNSMGFGVSFTIAVSEGGRTPATTMMNLFPPTMTPPSIPIALPIVPQERKQGKEKPSLSAFTFREARVDDAQGIIDLRNGLDMTNATSFVWSLDEMRTRIANRSPLILIATTVDSRDLSPTFGREIVVGCSGIDLYGMEKEFPVQSLGSRLLRRFDESKGREVRLPPNEVYVFTGEYCMCRGLLIHKDFQGAGLGSHLHTGRLKLLAQIAPNTKAVILSARGSTVMETMQIIGPHIVDHEFAHKSALEAEKESLKKCADAEGKRIITPERSMATPEFGKDVLFEFTFVTSKGIVHMVHGKEGNGWSFVGIDTEDGGPVWLTNVPLPHLVSSYKFPLSEAGGAP